MAAPGVPASVAVPLPLFVNVTPGGSVPVCVIEVARGEPATCTVNEPAVPAVNVVAAGLVNFHFVAAGAATNTPLVKACGIDQHGVGVGEARAIEHLQGRFAAGAWHGEDFDAAISVQVGGRQPYAAGVAGAVGHEGGDRSERVDVVDEDRARARYRAPPSRPRDRRR